MSLRQASTRIDLSSRHASEAIALLARIGLAFTFWLSGQTKIEGLVLDPLGLQVQWGWPHVSESALELFRNEYALPLLPPDWAAWMAATAEHVLPLMLILGLGTRVAALGILGMTLVIQVFVYPLAFPTHALWAASALALLVHGGGRLALDRPLARRFARKGA
ncbi:DoxX family protein [Thermomonas mangrovi]|uniref:DoxX family protein n=1 Tax=Thermomonas mangrovi TaxID=2993316 RepID=UPI0023082DE8|nr:DoxX family protein [Thermomonas mangrovi]